MVDYPRLRGELERRVPAHALRRILTGSLGLPPLDLPADAPSGAVVRAAVAQCDAHGALPALVEAVAHTLGEPPLSSAWAALRAEQWLAPDTTYGEFRILAPVPDALPVGQVYLAARGKERGYLTRLYRTPEEDRERWLLRQRRLREQAPRGVLVPSHVGRGPDGHAYAYHRGVAGRALHVVVAERGPLSLGEADRICRGVAETMLRLEALGLAHGALDARDVLLTREGVVLLLHAGVDVVLEPGLLHRSDDQGLVGLYDAATRMGDGDTYAQRRPDAPPALCRFVDDALSGRSVPPVAQFTAHLHDAFVSLARAELDTRAYALAEAALRAQPTDARAAALEQIAAPAHAFEELLASLQSVLINTTAAERVLVYQRIGRIAATALGDHRAALTAYREALDIDEGASAARACVESILRLRADWPGLADALVAGAAQTADGAVRSRALRTLAAVREDRLHDPDGALLAWIEVLRDDPSDDTAAHAIERLAGRSSARWNEALLSLAGPLEGSTDPADAALWVRLGRWYAYQLDRPDVALPCFTEAAALDLADDTPYEETLALYRSIGEHQLAVDLLEERAATHPNPALARSFRARAAETYWAQLANPGRALTLLRGVVAEDATDLSALALLRTILTAQKDHHELARALEVAARHAHGHDRARLLTELAQLQEGPLADPASAARSYRAAIASDAAHLPAHRGLEQLLTRDGELPELLACLHAQVTVPQPTRQLVALLEQIAALQEEEFADPAAAARAYERVLELQPAHHEATLALVRLRLELGETGAAVSLLEAHAPRVQVPLERHTLWLQAAHLSVDALEDDVRAEAALQRLLGDRATSTARVEALALMAALLERRGATTSAVSTLERLLEWTDAPAERAEHLVRAAALATQAGDLDGAVAHLREALAQQPDHREAAHELRVIHALRGDHRAAATLFRKELAMTPSGAARLPLLVGLGNVLTLHLYEHDEARALFEEALRIDASSVPALRGLAELLWRDGALVDAALRYEEALEHLAASAPLQAATGEAAIVEMTRRAGETWLGVDAARALRVLQLGLRLTPSETTPQVEGLLAQATLEVGDAERAQALFRHLVETAARGSEAQRYEWALGLARATLALGDAAGAEQAFQRAAREPGADGRALAAVERLLAEAGRYRELEETLVAHVGSTLPPQQAPLYARLGDIRFAHLHDLRGAADAYSLALAASKGADLRLLHRLMMVFGEAGEWQKLSDVVLDIAEQVDDPTKRAKYLVTAGVIAHDELEELGAAAAHFGAALALDPSSQPAHEGLTRVFSSAGSWDAFERECERRAEHASASEQAMLLVRTAQVRRENHGDVAGAVERLERACALAPGKREVLVALADAYAESDAPMHAAPIHQALIRLDPYRVDSYHALGAVHRPDVEVDRAMLVCSVLNALGEANEEERTCYDFLHESSMAHPQVPVSQELFDAFIRHPSQDACLTALIERIEPVIWISRRHRAADYGLLPEEQGTQSHNGNHAVQTLRAAARAFALPMPEIYWRPREPGCLSTLIFEQPAVGLGRSALTHAADQELAFSCARQVALLRPGHGVREVVTGADDLKAWVLGAITLVHPEFEIPEGLREDVTVRRERLVAHLPAEQRADLAARVERVLDSAPKLDLRRYLAAVELSADRMGLVLANDVVVAKQAIERAPSGLVAQRERLGDLLGYSASDDYVELRRVLGVAVA